MVLGLLLRDEEEQHLRFDFELVSQRNDPNDSHSNGNNTSSGISRFLSNEDDGMKKDFKRGTVVCRHWLRGLCMKGDSCEFLHQYDMSKMPECRWGMECQVPECPFRHVPDEDRMECAFYRQGFCSHGPNCRYRHIKLAREECPETADFALQSKVAEEENVKRRKTQPVNEFYKIAICKHWEKLGSCPFGDECHFAHGEQELRPFPRQNERADPIGFQKAGAPDSFPVNEAIHPIPLQEPQPRLPDADRNCAYFILHSFSYHNIAHSVHYQQWSLSSSSQQQLRELADSYEVVFMFITVTSSRHFQGVIRLTRDVIQRLPTRGEDLSSGIVPYQTDTRSSWDGVFPIEWLRICECPWECFENVASKYLFVPNAPKFVQLEIDQGRTCLHILFSQPQIQLHYKSVEDEQALNGGAFELAVRRREAAASVYNNPNTLSTFHWRVSIPGFVFACNNLTIDECFGRLLFGLGKDHEAIAKQHVVPGTPLFLLNMSDRHLLGVFEAVSPSVVNMVPNAFSHSPHQMSPFPVQTRFVVQMNAPPISTTEPMIKQLFGDRGVRIGPITLSVTQKLADIFAQRCGVVLPPPNVPPFRPSHVVEPSQTAFAGVNDTNESTSPPAYFERIVIGIDNDPEFCVTKRIIGPSGAHMKRIIAEAGGNAKIRLRGRGSGSKEPGAEEIANEPLAVLISSENERSFTIACEQARALVTSIRQDYHSFSAQRPPHDNPIASNGENRIDMSMTRPPLHPLMIAEQMRYGLPPGQKVLPHFEALNAPSIAFGQSGHVNSIDGSNTSIIQTNGPPGTSKYSAVRPDSAMKVSGGNA